ncbi:NtaA/DmoA family FMN-dependent monooxygenase [Cellulomonas sp. NPDC055163]
MPTLHLVASLMTPGHFRTAWRLPHADPGANLDVEHYTRLARIADEVGLDAIFLGDGPALGADIASTPSGGIDPLVLLGHLLAVTQRVGGVVTSSSTYNAPYNLARRFQALDIVTRGRAAVNVVTTFAPAAAANFGLAEPLDKKTRYRRAHEFLDVVTRLWDGWEPGAVVADRATGVYADVSRIHPADHRGEFFSVAGPLPVPPGPQGRPVVVQAGGSDGGLALGARFADVVFAVAQTRARAVALRDDVRARAAAAGRDPDQVKVSLGVVVLVGETEQDARDRLDELVATLPVDDLARGVLSALGLPGRDLDEPIGLEDLPEVPVGESGSVGFQLSTRALLAERPLSARGLVRHTAGGPAGGHRLVVGSPEQVADDLQAWWAAGAADGFTVMYADTAVDFERFARLVVPILVERGLFAAAEAGVTLRERLGVAGARGVPSAVARERVGR